MGKKDLEKEIDDLKKRVTDLEKRMDDTINQLSKTMGGVESNKIDLDSHEKRLKGLEWKSHDLNSRFSKDIAHATADRTAKHTHVIKEINVSRNEINTTRELLRKEQKKDVDDRNRFIKEINKSLKGLASDINKAIGSLQKQINFKC